jgi:hypothetical protein
MSFPNAQSKDLMPDVASEFRTAAEKVTRKWLSSNAAEINKSSSVGFSSFNRNPNAIQTNHWNDYHP